MFACVFVCSGYACLCCALSQQQRRVLSLSLSLLLLLCALITPERVVVVARVVVAVRVVVPVHFVVIAAAVWFFFFGFGNVVERAPALRVAPSTSLLPSSSLSLSLLQLNCNEHVAATQPPLPLLLLLVSFDFYFVFGFFGKFVKFSSPTLRWLPLSLPPLLLSHSPSFSVSLVSPLLLASTLICLNCFLINYQRHFLFIVCQAIFFFFFTSFLSSLFWRLYSL